MINIKYELIKKDFDNIYNNYIYTKDGKKYYLKSNIIESSQENSVLLEKRIITIKFFKKCYSFIRVKPIMFYIYDGFVEWN